MCDDTKKYTYICYDCEAETDEPKECCGKPMVRMND